jgi:hypothetical protein
MLASTSSIVAQYKSQSSRKKQFLLICLLTNMEIDAQKLMFEKTLRKDFQFADVTDNCIKRCRSSHIVILKTNGYFYRLAGDNRLFAARCLCFSDEVCNRQWRQSIKRITTYEKGEGNFSVHSI